MEIKNLDNDNVLRIGVSVYKISGITIKATFGIWDTPVSDRTCYGVQNESSQVELTLYQADTCIAVMAWT